MLSMFLIEINLDHFMALQSSDLIMRVQLPKNECQISETTRVETEKRFLPWKSTLKTGDTPVDLALGFYYLSFTSSVSELKAHWPCH